MQYMSEPLITQLNIYGPVNKYPPHALHTRAFDIQLLNIVKHRVKVHMLNSVCFRLFATHDIVRTNCPWISYITKRRQYLQFVRMQIQTVLLNKNRQYREVTVGFLASTQLKLLSFLLSSCQALSISRMLFSFQQRNKTVLQMNMTQKCLRGPR